MLCTKGKKFLASMWRAALHPDPVVHTLDWLLATAGGGAPPPHQALALRTLPGGKPYALEGPMGRFGPAAARPQCHLPPDRHPALVMLYYAGCHWHTRKEARNARPDRRSAPGKQLGGCHCGPRQLAQLQRAVHAAASYQTNVSQLVQKSANLSLQAPRAGSLASCVAPAAASQSGEAGLAGLRIAGAPRWQAGA